MQKGDHVIVADLSLALRSASALTWGGLIVSGTTMVSCRTLEASAIAPGCGKWGLPCPDDTRPHITVIDTCSTCDATTATRHCPCRRGAQGYRDDQLAAAFTCLPGFVIALCSKGIHP